MTKNYSKIHLEDAPRHELHDALGLTGADVSINTLPAGVAVPFVHEHQHNEELYGVLEGSGEFYLDGEVIKIQVGDWIRVLPKCHRAIRSSDKSALRFICIQTKVNSLEGFTMGDGVICQDKAPWH